MRTASPAYEDLERSEIVANFYFINIFSINKLLTQMNDN